MLKQSSSRMKKVLAILLAVLFVVSLTAVAVSAANEMKDPSSEHPERWETVLALEIVLVITYGMHAELRMDAHTVLTSLSTLIMRPIFNFIL